MSAEMNSKVQVFDKDSIAPDLGGNFKGINFIRITDSVSRSGEKLYILEPDHEKQLCKVLFEEEEVASIPLKIPKFSRGLMAKIAKLERKPVECTNKIILPRFERYCDGSLMTSLK
ncbi:MAG: hypothetical protein GF364_20305 [Candidatus Lokiarchaeota archaeon]|nr:hypothetical protein [Candidatus Lokiarchaeota archaeon]